MALLETDVLVIGSGPAGSAAARAIASRGHRVVLIDRHAFPRDKVCGDALAPDALAALARLGLKQQITSEGRALHCLHVCAPDGSRVVLDAQIACLPRRRLDDLMRVAAVDSGAEFLAPYGLARAIEADGRVAGAVFHHAATREEIRITARFTLLATGAAARPLDLFGVCERQAASAIAARIYLEASDSLGRRYPDLCISYDRDICPGYGWVFPLPDLCYNIGVGYFHDAKTRPPTTNLRQLLARFVEGFAPARALVAGSRALTDVRGAPLRTALGGSTLGRPGLLVIGEAAGLTYSFTGEGIGKAIESGILAGEMVSHALSDGHASGAEVAQRYASSVVARFGRRFRAYRLAQGWLEHAPVLNFLARRANAGAYVRRQMQALLTESAEPGSLFSAAGMLRSLIR